MSDPSSERQGAGGGGGGEGKGAERGTGKHRDISGAGGGGGVKETHQTTHKLVDLTVNTDINSTLLKVIKRKGSH